MFRLTILICMYDFTSFHDAVHHTFEHENSVMCENKVCTCNLTAIESLDALARFPPRARRLNTREDL